MRHVRLLSSALLLATALTPSFARTRRHTSTAKITAPVKHKPVIGQRGIDDTRATQIQEALVRSGYMTETTGHWDSTTETAMQKFQSDNGWQTKLMPDSRAIIKLGLGPTQTSSLVSNGLPSQLSNGEATR
ncbi:MAG TPA: peptidoglycan-binding protein [Edaphobacter sp.]